MPVAGEENAGNEGQAPDIEAIVAERTAALKQNTDQAIRELRQARAKLKDYEGVDPEEHRALKSAADEAARKQALAEGNLEVWKKQVTDQHQKEKSGLESRLAKFESFTSRTLRNDELRKALVGKADPSMMELLVEHGSKFIHVRETDEGFEKYVGDEKGNAMVADAQGSPMTTEVFVDQVLKSKFPGAFLGSGSSGGGAPRSNAGGGGVTTIASTNDPSFLANLDSVAAGKTQVAGQ
jgi:hypothetical protein